MKISKLAIIVPVFNEEKTLPIIWNKIQKLKIAGTKLEVIWIDDGSTDGSRALLLDRKSQITNHKKQKNIFIFKEINEGKGAAIVSGLTKATGEYVIIQDADLEYNPEEITKLVQKAETENLAAVFGSRDREIKNKYRYPHFYWGSRVLCILMNILYGQKYTDPETCYKLVKKDILEKVRISERGFGMEIEVAAKIAQMKVPFAEVGITYKPRSFAEGKKIKVQDGLRAIYLIFRLWRSKISYR
jgi:dolichol-phosphate mannosyltransferase